MLEVHVLRQVFHGFDWALCLLLSTGILLIFDLDRLQLSPCPLRTKGQWTLVEEEVMKCSQGNAFLVDYIRNCNSAWWSAVSLSQITMGTVLLLLSLFTLLHITYGNLLDCSTQIKGTPPNFTQVSELETLIL